MIRMSPFLTAKATCQDFINVYGCKTAGSVCCMVPKIPSVVSKSRRLKGISVCGFSQCERYFELVVNVRADAMTRIW